DPPARGGRPAPRGHSAVRAQHLRAGRCRHHHLVRLRLRDRARGDHRRRHRRHRAGAVRAGHGRGEGIRRRHAGGAHPPCGADRVQGFERQHHHPLPRRQSEADQAGDRGPRAPVPQRHPDHPAGGAGLRDRLRPEHPRPHGQSGHGADRGGRGDPRHATAHPARGPAVRGPRVRLQRQRARAARPAGGGRGRRRTEERGVSRPAGEGRPAEHPGLRRAVAASAIGNATEWFDYGIYAYGLTYISAALFPGDTQEATLFALATFAISFLIRPLGGFFWGPLGDRFGRKSVLAMTILLMAGATFLVGLVPSYETAGFWAPLLLIVLRMVQGFSTGGEYGGAATFMAEYAPDHRRGFFGSFLEFGTLAGFSFGALLMLGASLALGDEAMRAGGWRIPFLIAAPLGLVGLYLRSRTADTPVFREMEAAAEARGQAHAASLKELAVRHWPALLTMGGLVTALNVVNY